VIDNLITGGHLAIRIINTISQPGQSNVLEMIQSVFLEENHAPDLNLPNEPTLAEAMPRLEEEVLGSPQ
jgi:hypothetical protein